MFARRNRLTTHFSERIPLAKWCVDYLLVRLCCHRDLLKTDGGTPGDFLDKSALLPGSTVRLIRSYSAPCSSILVRWSVGHWALRAPPAVLLLGMAPSLTSFGSLLKCYLRLWNTALIFITPITYLTFSEHLSFSDNTRFLVSFPIKCKFQVGRHFVFSLPHYTLCLPHIIGVH